MQDEPHSPATDRLTTRPFRASLALAGGLAFLAGATDAYGVTRMGDVFVSFMSGNTTLLALAMGSGDVARAAHIFPFIALFVAGAAAGAAVSDRTGRFRMTSVILVASAALGFAESEPSWSAHASAFAMGTLNAALVKVGPQGVGLTYVTGALVKFGQGIGHWFAGTNPGLAWSVNAAMWGSILLGAYAMTVAMRLGEIGPWPLPLLGLMQAIAAFLIERPSNTLSSAPSSPGL